MCKCTPSIRTPFCGRGECVWLAAKAIEDELRQIGHLAIRQEGVWWKAYYVLSQDETAKNSAAADAPAPIMLGSIRFSAIRDNVARRREFITCMRGIIDDLMIGLFGTPGYWPRPMPEPTDEQPPRNKMS